MEILEIYLNSKSASKYNNGNVSDALYSLPPVQIGRTEKAYICIKDAVIPYSFYNVNDNNNVLNYTLNSVDYSVSITKGNYNVHTLRDYLINQLLLTDGTVWIVTYSSFVNKFLFSNASYDFTFLDTSSCFEILGFKSDVSYNSTSLSLTSAIGINLFTIKNIYVTSYNFILNNIDSNNHNMSNIICSIPVNGTPNSVLFYEDNTKHLVYNVDNLTNLNIRLTDESGNLIDLNDVHYSITLEITITK